ncbi:MAG: head-tail adaptor protein [Lactobacillus sp.]|nr:head-tail adaptor protein [Lactobacillus sp.]
MPISQTGNLNEIIQIIQIDSSNIDDYGDITPKNNIIYSMLYAYQRNLNANEVAGNIETLRNQTQFVIRHRHSKEPKITTDMEVIHNNQQYHILAYNQDSAFKEWDVLICEKAGEE